MVVKKLNICDDLYKVFLKIHLVLNDIELQPKVESILLYFIKHGISEDTTQKILADNVVPKIQSISNAKTILYENGILLKRPWRLNKSLDSIKIEDVLDFHIRCKKKEK